MPVKTPYERILARRVIDEKTGCWLCKGASNGGSGHVQVRVKKNGKWKKDYAHRVSYEHHHGPIPAGMVVRHNCDTPPCFNPEHLCLGSVAQNNRDIAERGRWANQYGPCTAFVNETDDCPF